MLFIQVFSFTWDAKTVVPGTMTRSSVPKTCRVDKAFSARNDLGSQPHLVSRTKATLYVMV